MGEVFACWGPGVSAVNDLLRCESTKRSVDGLSGGAGNLSCDGDRSPAAAPRGAFKPAGGADRISAPRAEGLRHRLRLARDHGGAGFVDPMGAAGALSVRKKLAAVHASPRELAAFKDHGAHPPDGADVAAAASLAQIFVAGVRPAGVLPRGEGSDLAKEPAGHAGPRIVIGWFVRRQCDGDRADR